MTAHEVAHLGERPAGFGEQRGEHRPHVPHPVADDARGVDAGRPSAVDELAVLVPEDLHSAVGTGTDAYIAVSDAPDKVADRTVQTGFADDMPATDAHHRPYASLLATVARRHGLRHLGYVI